MKIFITFFITHFLCLTNALLCWECNKNRSIDFDLKHTQNFCDNYDDLGVYVNCNTSCIRDINYQDGKSYFYYYKFKKILYFQLSM